MSANDTLKGFSFPFRVLGGGVRTSSAKLDGSVVNKINENIMLAIGTNRGERTDKQFGLSCRSMIFKAYNDDLIEYYKSEIKDCVEYAVNQVDVINVDFDRSLMRDESKIIIRVYWKFKNSSNGGSVEVNL